ncbi:MAG: hypothetical protein COU07_02385 [Candidatus Harrisonbacteria bacterium CG10_big_fil_rev_8_21_14_0_10_40_38]|uniref:HTH lysR-type domain-containing protein n=1 Tax=Candidatus Harrisonbacteria bacterium CG10_big_fil_rev_8_21_14_0_10_40_38 TaxID=1974583 RepID=A0A2H0URY7_9BACT|nr:MAG: hypothetical protein COU07_02385 [Candidatus Harrisonbacteria bacterium CG10_big_fil_rev_8_21_14_0_10_40_38]
MDLSSDRLNALSALARFRNFSIAARSLGITQSALSQRIQKLEDDLEATLIVRDPSGLRLTDTGEKLTHFSNQISDLEREALGQIKKIPGKLSGIVRIAGYSSITRSLVIPSLRSLADTHPDLRFEISSKEIRELIPMLRRGEADFVLLNREIEGEGLERIHLGVEENVCIVPGKLPFPDIYLDHDPDDLTTIRFFKRQKSQPKIIKRSYFDDIYGIIDAVQNGLGKAIVSKHLIKNLKNITIQKGLRSLKEPIILYYLSSPYQTLKNKEVVRVLGTEIPNLLTQ